MPAVSVVIPAYNGGRRLREAVDSVLAQTLHDFELVIVDDGGQEDVSWAGPLDNRICVITQQNGGVSSARNAGARRSSAPLIAYLDQDDRWRPTKLERQLSELSPDDVASVTDFAWCDSADNSTPAYQKQPLTREALLRGSHFCLSTLMVRRSALEAVGPFDERLAIVQDWELLIRLAGRGPIGLVKEVLTDYVVHDDNQSRDYLRGYRERVGVMRAAPERAAARAGLRDSRRLYGAQAWSAFRAQRRPQHLLRTLQWSPQVIGRAAAKKVSAVWRRG